MKRMFFVVSAVYLLSFCNFAKAEHTDPTTGGRTIIKIPAISASERLNELINACSVGRPFPSLRFKQVDLTPPAIQPPGEVGIPPTVPPTTPPPPVGDTTSGQGIYQARCASCHDSGMAPPIKGNVAGVEARTSLTDDDAKKMPPSGPRLTSDERSALLSYIQTGQ